MEGISLPPLFTFWTGSEMGIGGGGVGWGSGMWGTGLGVGGGCVKVDQRIGVVVWKFGHRQFWWGRVKVDHRIVDTFLSLMELKMFGIKRNKFLLIVRFS